MKSPRRILERSALKAKLRLTPSKPDSVHRLLALLESVPPHRPAIDAWHQETSALIRSLITSRVASDDLAAILAGVAAYRATGVTPENAHQSLVAAYCNTSGQFQELFHRIFFSRPAGVGQPTPASPVFGTIDTQVAGRIQAELRETGYCILPFRLPPNTIEEIRKESAGYDYNLRDRQDESVPKRITGIDPARPPRSVAAYADNDQVMGSHLLTGLAADPLIISLVSDYMGAETEIIDATLWYSFPSASVSSESAQMFHFDLDTLRWLKVFYYLSDVGPESGPHCYVQGSHSPGAKPAELLRAGYARITDAEMDAAYPGKTRTITGPAGTIIIGDTRSFHKGTQLTSGHRLIYSPIYAPSRIGYFHGKTLKT